MTHLLRYAARTDRGLLRANNQDSVFAGDRLLVIADGMGGHAAGDVASRLVVAAFVDLDELPLGSDMVAPLADATRHGNAAIAEMVDQNPEFDGMGTTLTALLFDGPVVALAHVGDSRAYLYRNGVLHQISHDDTFVQSLVDDGRITQDEAAHHPQRSLLLRALNGTEMEPSITLRETSPGDRFLICSDGLSDVVSPESIADALSGPNPDQVADTLIQLALVGGGPDNVTVIVADVLETGRDGRPYGVPAGAIDPEATGPMQAIHLTQKMPRVPLPPIPEEAAARPEYAPAEDGDSDDEPYDEDEDYAEEPYDEELDTDPGGHPVDGAAADSGSPATGAPDSAQPGAGRMVGAPNRPRWHRRAAFALALVVLVGVVLGGSYLWASTKYYVGEDGEQVAVFQGLNGSVLGLKFASVEENSCGTARSGCTPLKVNDLVQAARDQVSAGIPVSTLSDARDVINRLNSEQLPPCPTPAPPTTSGTSTGSALTPSSSSAVTSGSTGGSIVPTSISSATTTGAPAFTNRATTGASGKAATGPARGTVGETPTTVTTTVTVTVNPFGPAVSGEVSSGQRLRGEPFGAVAPTPVKTTPKAARTSPAKTPPARTPARGSTPAKPTSAKPRPTTVQSPAPVTRATPIGTPTVTVLTTVTSTPAIASGAGSTGVPLTSPAAQPGITCRTVS